MGIVDIEGKRGGAQGAEGGSTDLDTETNDGGGLTLGAEGTTTVFKSAIMVGISAAVLFVGFHKLFRSQKLASDSMVVNDLNAEEGPHWWHQ